MANKAGRPKAKVSISFSEQELKTIIAAVHTSTHTGVDNFNQFSVLGMQMFGDDVLLLAKLRDIREKKFGDAK